MPLASDWLVDGFRGIRLAEGKSYAERVERAGKEHEHVRPRDRPVATYAVTQRDRSCV